jgi:hypothetical protein
MTVPETPGDGIFPVSRQVLDPPDIEKVNPQCVS